MIYSGEDISMNDSTLLMPLGLALIVAAGLVFQAVHATPILSFLHP